LAADANKNPYIRDQKALEDLKAVYAGIDELKAELECMRQQRMLEEHKAEQKKRVEEELLAEFMPKMNRMDQEFKAKLNERLKKIEQSSLPQEQESKQDPKPSSSKTSGQRAPDGPSNIDSNQGVCIICPFVVRSS
jgi:hypothetical protein